MVTVAGWKAQERRVEDPGEKGDRPRE